MNQDLFPQQWLTNTLLDDGLIDQKASELAAKPLPHRLDAWLQTHFDSDTLAARNEPQLEEKFIAPLLAKLGWSKAYQVGITVQGKYAKPDYCLVLHAAQGDQLTQLYGINDTELAHLLCSFKVMVNKRPEYLALLR